MKTKGITIWEKHAEKFVLAVAFLAACTFAALQFVGEPNAVPMNAKQVAPGEIDELLQKRAEELLAKLRDDAPSGLDLPYPKLGFDDLLAQRDESLSPAEELPPFQIALAPSVVGVGIGKSLELPVPKLKPPDQVAVGQYADALAAGVVDRYPELQDRFKTGEPQDLVFATVRARFDLADLRRQFRGDDAAADAAIIPSSWYNDRPENLVDVVVEREELQDGAWTDHRTIEPIPGQTSYRKEISGELYASLRDEVLSRLIDPAVEFAVIQPPFYPTKSEDWSVPEWHDEAAAATDDTDARIAKLKQSLRQFFAERDRLIEKLEDAGGELDKDDQQDRRGGGGDAGGGGGIGGGGNSGKRAPPGRRDAPGKGAGGFGAGGGGLGKRDGGGGDDMPGKDKERLIKSLKVKIKQVDRKIEYTDNALRDLGVDPNAVEIAVDPYAAIDGDEILVWGHDIDVKPGRTYRYRVTVSVFNPFFGKKRSLVEAQQSLAEVFTLNTPASEWSEPVRIHPLRRVFITNATRTDTQGGFGRATAEVYLFYDGTQWVEKFSVQPGNTIGEVKDVRLPDGSGEMKIDFTTTLFVLDIVEPVATSRGEAGRPDMSHGDARVVLRDLEDPKVVEMRDPAVDDQDPERQRLRDKLPRPEPRT